jgi:hypothetical protein
MSNKNSLETSFEEYLREGLAPHSKYPHVPNSPPEIGEIELGIIKNPVTKSFWSLGQEINSSIKNMAKEAVEILETSDKDQIEALRRELRKLRGRSECCSNIFWEMVYDEFPKAQDSKVAVGIREEWKVVIFKSSDPLSEFFNLGIFEA